MGYANALGGNPTAFLGSDGRIWVYYRRSNGQLEERWFKGTEFGEKAWGSANAVGGNAAALEVSPGVRKAFYFDPEAFPFLWSFSGIGGEFTPLIY